MGRSPRDSIMATSSPMAAQQAQRRKRRKSRERLRVTRACDHCKRQKVRCTGALPCEVCVKKGAECTYDASYSRGRAPSIVVDDSAALATTTAPASSVRPPVAAELLTRPELRLEPTSSRASPEPSQTDRQGHYVGPASGVSFLLRAQRRVHQSLSLPQPSSSIFTFGDAPLPETDASFFVLAPKDDTRKLMDRYFDFAVPTHRFLHRPTVEAWHDEFYAHSGSMAQNDEAPAKIAVLFMVFAQASLYMPTADSEHAAVSDASARYFVAAEHQLQKERGQVRLASVQARLAQCFYLLSRSRINHCWSLFGTTAHLALAIGLNRGRRAEPSNAARRIETECRRRVFWCAYNLDKYLAAALGRPRTLREEDIDQELPLCVDDADLLCEPAPTPAHRGQSLMRASIAHIELSRIIDKILKDLYPIWPLSSSTRVRTTAQCSDELKRWYAKLADFLDSGVNTSLLLPIYQRQRNVLHLAFWHATILTHRPFLLGKLGKLRNGQLPTDQASRQQQQMDESVQKCLQAALNICDLVDGLFNSNMMFKSFWFTSYYAFCAVIVIYVYIIQTRALGSVGYEENLSVATKCQTQMSRIAEEHSLAMRYCLVLEELRKEAVRPPEDPLSSSLNGVDDSQAATVGGHLEHDQSPQAQRQHFGAQVHSVPMASIMTAVDGSGLDVSPGSSLHDMAGWGMFDTMVTSGFGDLGDLMDDGSFGFRM